MLDKTEEDRGTVQVAVADAAADLMDDGKFHCCILYTYKPNPHLELGHLGVELGPKVPGRQTLSENLQATLMRHYNSNGVHRVHTVLTRQPPRGSVLFKPTTVRFYEHALLDHRRIVPTTRTRRRTAGSSLVKVTWREQMFAGIVESIFHHDQPRIEDGILWAEIRWMKHLDVVPAANDPWSIV